MERAKDTGEQRSDGIVALLRDAADDFGLLIANHLKLTRIELRADIKAYSSRVAILGALIPIALLGYTFVCLGICLAISRWLGLSVALFLVGGVHLVGAVAAWFAAVHKLQNVNPMHDAVYEASESMSSLAERVPHEAKPSIASLDCTTLGAPALVKGVEKGSRLVDLQR